MAAARSTFEGLLALSGALVWAVHFAAVYGITSLLCARSAASVQWLGIGVVAWSVGAATLIALGALVALFVRARRAAHPGGFLSWITAAVAALAAVAIVWETLPVLLRTACE